MNFKKITIVAAVASITFALSGVTPVVAAPPAVTPAAATTLGATFEVPVASVVSEANPKPRNFLDANMLAKLNGTNPKPCRELYGR